MKHENTAEQATTPMKQQLHTNGEATLKTKIPRYAAGDLSSYVPLLINGQIMRRSELSDETA